MAKPLSKRKKSSKLQSVLQQEQRPDSLQAWRKAHSKAKLLVRYENGEEEVVDIRRVEPTDDDFELLQEGQTVCCKAKSGRYEAHVLRITCDESSGHGGQKTATPSKRKTKEIDDTEERAKCVKLTKKKIATTKDQERAERVKRTKKKIAAIKDQVARESQMSYFGLEEDTGEHPDKETLCVEPVEKPSCSGAGQLEVTLQEIIAKELQKQLHPLATTFEDLHKRMEHMAELITSGPDQPYKLNPDSPASLTPNHQSVDCDDCSSLSPVLPLPEKNVLVYTPPASSGPEVTIHTDNEPQDPPVKISTEQPSVTVEGRPRPGPKPQFPVQYCDIGNIKVNSTKLTVASKAPTPYKMARKLLPEFFTKEELSNCTCVPPKPGAKVIRPQVDREKLQLLFCEVTKVFPSGWESSVMLSKLNQAFIDFRNKHQKAT